MKIRLGLMAALLVLPLLAGAQDPAPEGCAKSKGPCESIELTDLIGRFSKRTGKQFIVDPRVRAVVPLMGADPDRLSYEKLLAILNVHMYAAVTQGEWIVVVPDANARQLPTPVYTDKNFKAAADEIVTYILPVKHICAAQSVPVLRPLLPQSAHMAAYPDGNILILSDHAANVRRIVTIVEAMERNAPDGRGCESPKKD
jgi:general secretion pathway protein D